MNQSNQVLARIGTTQAVEKATNAAATVTLAAPGKNMRWLVLSQTISMNADPLVVSEYSITTGSTVIERIQFPAIAVGPLSISATYLGGINEAVVCTLPALGAGVVGCVSVRAQLLPVGF